MVDLIEPMRTMLVEAVAETSEELMENTLKVKSLPRRNSVQLGRSYRGEIVPVLCGSAVNNLGIKPLMNTIVAYMPSPEEPHH